MATSHSPPIKLGSVIYGRVSGYPWWPGIIALCPVTQLWTKGGKFWVRFFNDNAGAWLKETEVRIFDPYNRDLCYEYNSSIAKFRRYQDRIRKAISLADTHINFPARRLRVKILPPKKEALEEDEILAGENNGALTPSSVERPEKTSRKKGRSSSKCLIIPSEKSPECSSDSSSEEERAQSDGNGTAIQGRPKRRKRSRSMSYIDCNTLRDNGLEKGKRNQVLSPASKAQGGIQKAAQSGTTTAKGKSSTKVKESSKSHMVLRRSKRMRGGAQKTAENDACNGNNENVLGNVVPENIPEVAIQNSIAVPDYIIRSHPTSSVASSQMNRTPGNTKLGAIEAIQPQLEAGIEKNTSNRRGKRKQNVIVKKEMFLAELSNLTRKKLGRSLETYDSLARGGIRSRVFTACDSSKQVNLVGECTDSEEMPERERKRSVGSLEVAAEDLLEYVIMDGQCAKENLVDHKENGPSFQNIALGGSDLVGTILNRLSNLERDVVHLKKKESKEQQAKLGEDATAAGVKSAVEALAAASAAFAKARDYNSARISRSLPLLWSDGEFPLVGADGDLLRTVAQSLIFASCKRRRVEIAQENETPANSRELGRHGSSDMVNNDPTPEDGTSASVDDRGTNGLPPPTDNAEESSSPLEEKKDETIPNGKIVIA